MGVAHCATSNMKLYSGVTRVRAMVERGIPVGLAVDGSASNAGSNMLTELRTSYLLQQLANSPDALDSSEYLRFATVGGTSVLSRTAVGSLEACKAGDFS